MKRITLIAVVVMLLFAVFGCSKETKYEFNGSDVLSLEDSIVLFNSTESPKGKSVSLLGKVFSSITDDGITYYQVFAEHETSDTSVMIKLPEGDSTKLKDGDYIEANGVVFGVMEGTNIFGSDVSSPVIAINEYEVGAYVDIVARIQKTIEINQKQVQNGLEIIIDKIEFSDYDTRLHLTVNNLSSDNVSMYSSNFKLISDGKNYTEEYNYEIDYIEMDNDLSSNTTTNGVVGYLPMEYNNLKDIKIIIEAPYSANWDIDFEDYIFEIKV